MVDIFTQCPFRMWREIQAQSPAEIPSDEAFDGPSASSQHAPERLVEDAELLRDVFGFDSATVLNTFIDRLPDCNAQDNESVINGLD